MLESGELNDLLAVDECFVHGVVGSIQEIRPGFRLVVSDRLDGCISKHLGEAVGNTCVQVQQPLPDTGVWN